MMAVDSLSAAKAYGQAAKIAKSLSEGQSNIGDVKQGLPNFKGLVTDNVSDLVDSGRKMDNQAMNMMRGKTDVVGVVTSVAETQAALETVVAVRDKVIQAYEKVLQMPI